MHASGRVPGLLADSPRCRSGRHLVLYDGVCGLCNRFVAFVLAHDRWRRFQFASIQSEVGRNLLVVCGRNPERLDTVYVVVDYESQTGQVLDRARAFLFVCDQLGWPWCVVKVVRWAPTALLDWLYDRVATYRYAVLGRYAVCRLPDPGYRSRFL